MDVANSTDMVLFYYLSITFTNFNVIVDRMIVAPGHKNDVVDGINSCDKYYLMGKSV